MKIVILLIASVSIMACHKVKNMEKDFSKILEVKKKLEIYEIEYGSKNIIFHEGYSVKDKKSLNKDLINQLVIRLKDSSNYSLDKSRNCVLVANYGIKLSTDSYQYTVFIGKKPCIKIAVLENVLKSEITFDLSDNNTITPFLDSIFKK